MKKLIILYLAITTIALAVEWEAGVDNSIHYNGKDNVLQNSNEVPRQMSIDVNFNRLFSKPPKVLIAHDLLDIEANFPVIYKCYVSNVRNSGFTYVCEAGSAGAFYTLRVRWLAILDSKIQINYYTFQTDILADNSQHRSEDDDFKQTFPITFDYPFDQPPNTVVFLLGASLQQWFEIGTYTADVTTNGATVEISCSENYIDWVYLAVVSVDSKFSVVSQDVGGNQGKNGHQWNEPDYSKRQDVFTVDDITEDYQKNGVLIWGFNLYDCSKDTNLRIAFDGVKVEFDTFYATLATWFDSASYGMFGTMIAYIPQEDCAVLYTECDFKGDTLEICAGSPVNSFQQQKFQGQNVKSVQVPAGRALTLFNSENLKGEKVVIRQDTPCINGWDWQKFLF